MEELESEKISLWIKFESSKIIVLVKSNFFVVLCLFFYHFLNNLTSSVLFCYTKDMNYIPPLPLLHWSMMIDFINVFTDDNTLQNKYSLQYESFILRNLNQRIIVTLIKVKLYKKNVCHNSFGWVNIFCIFILMILLPYQLYLLSIFLFY